MGREGLKSFYQQLSGNYFWVHGEPGPVRQYNVNCLSDDICPLVDACYRKNPQSGKGEYDFDNAVFSKEAFRDRKQWKLAFETDMEPSASEFLRLNEFAGCPASRNNADISKLLYLMENGFKRDIINDPDFGYRNVFQEYVTRIDDCINGQSSGPDLSDVLDDMRWKAKNILLTDFDVRGHRTLERTLNDRSVPFLINGTDAGEAMRQALLEGNIQVNARFTFPPCRKDMQPGNGIYQISRKQDRVSGEKRQNHSICTGFEKGIENEKEQFPQNVMI